MHIKDVEQRTGLSRANIRYYEQEGLVHPARRKNGYRDYSEADLEILEKIKLLRRLGVSVEELKAMILRHGQMMMEFKGELAGMREMRKHVAWYTAGYPNSAALRNEINSVATLEELTELIGTRL